MSCFIVSNDHIDAILTAVLKVKEINAPAWLGEDGKIRNASCTSGLAGVDAWSKIGAMLLNENIKSFNFRYEEDTPPADDYEFRVYREGRPGHVDLTPIQVLVLVDCYIYQSCEHPGWKYSEACRFAKAVKESMIYELPGYSDCRRSL